MQAAPVLYLSVSALKASGNDLQGNIMTDVFISDVAAWLRQKLVMTDIHLELRVNGVNKTFRGSSSIGEFFLRLSPASLHSADDIADEISLLDYISLHAATPLAVKPFKNLGRDDFDHEGSVYHAIATTVAPGQAFNGSVMHLHELGIGLKRLHSLSLPPDRTTCAPIKHLLHHHRPSVLYDCIGTLEVELNSWEAIARQKSMDTGVICHGDAWPGNAHFHPAGATLFDFEYSTIDTPLLDIGNVAWWLSGQKTDKAEKRDLWRAFIDGYAGPGQEWNLPDFTALPYFVLQAERKSLMFLHNYISLSDNSLNTVKERMQDLIHLWKGFDGKDHYIFPSMQRAAV